MESPSRKSCWSVTRSCALYTQVSVLCVHSLLLQGSYYLDDSNVTYSSGSIRSLERLSYQTLPYGYGSDTGGGRTDELLEYLVGRFGPVSSFSGSYRANAWTLNVQQQGIVAYCILLQIA